jgi:chromosome partitioning protein
LANQKGGVGKSAVARLLVHYLAKLGHRVLAIDLDHQANLTRPIEASGKSSSTAFRSAQILTERTCDFPSGELVLVPADVDGLLQLERQPERHNEFATNFRHFLSQHASLFDVCVIDTNPNPDIRLISALVGSQFVLSPIQLNQEAIDGIGALVKHPRVGVRRIKDKLNPVLELIGILPTMVEATPFQKANFTQIAQSYASLLIRTGHEATPFAYLPKRSVIAEAQATGAVLWEMKKTTARDTWREIEPSLAAIVSRMNLSGTTP